MAGFVVTVVTTLVLVDRVGIVAIPLGFAAGLAVRTVLQAIALALAAAVASPEAPEAVPA